MEAEVERVALAMHEGYRDYCRTILHAQAGLRHYRRLPKHTKDMYRHVARFVLAAATGQTCPGVGRRG